MIPTLFICVAWFYFFTSYAFRSVTNSRRGSVFLFMPLRPREHAPVRHVSSDAAGDDGASYYFRFARLSDDPIEWRVGLTRTTVCFIRRTWLTCPRPMKTVRDVRLGFLSVTRVFYSAILWTGGFSKSVVNDFLSCVKKNKKIKYGEISNQLYYRRSFLLFWRNFENM